VSPVAIRNRPYFPRFNGHKHLKMTVIVDNDGIESMMMMVMMVALSRIEKVLWAGSLPCLYECMHGLVF